jgi:hypothetical protein
MILLDFVHEMEVIIKKKILVEEREEEGNKMPYVK